MRENRGFSLIELIIVIAIMAVLVGFLVPMYVKHVEKSRIVNDEQLITAIHNALAAAILDENIASRPLSGFSSSPIKVEDIDETLYPEFVSEFKGFVQVDNTATLKTMLKSKEYKGQDILVEINGTTQQVTVTVHSNSGGDDFVVE